MPPKRPRARVSGTRPTPTTPSRDVAHFSMEQLRSLPVATIRAHLRSLSLSTSGVKNSLVKRLFDYHHSQDGTTTTDGASPPSDAVQPPGDPSSSPSSSGDLQSMVARLVQEGVQSAIQQLQHDESNISASSLDRSFQHPSPSSPHPQSRQDPSLPLDLPANLVTQPDLPPVPLAMRDKIMKGEYVDFNSLLQDNLFPLPNNDPSYSLQLQPDPDAQSDGFIITQPKQKRSTITDLPTWLQAWNVYALLRVYNEPHKALDLLAYQRCICQAASRSPCSAWLLYDKKFRMAAAANPELPWGKRHGELWLECFSSGLQQPGPGTRGNSSQSSSHNQSRRPCTYCGSLTHFPNNCHRNPFRSSFTPALSGPRDTTRRGANPASQPRPFRPVCHDFNAARCHRKVCNFRHQCSECEGRHPRQECPTRTSRT